MNPARLPSVGHIACSRLVVLFPALMILTALNLQADAPPTSVRIQNTGVDAEGLRTFRLEWDSVSNATYRVQQSGSLAPGALWKTVDVITPVGGTMQYDIKGRSIPENSVEFYRLLLPQAEIFSVEPAVTAPGVSVDISVVGQCFGSNDVLRINGVAQTTVFQSASLLTLPSFTPDVAGTYVFELVRGTLVVSSFNVTCADALSNPELVLQGPPGLSLASPQGVHASKKGYDYYQAQSQLNRAGANNNPYFHENQNQGEMPKAAFGGGDDDCDDEADDAFGALTAAQCNYFSAGNKVRICHHTSSSRKPFGVIPFSGEVEGQVIDLAVAGRGLDFIWARTYHSRLGRFDTSPNGWTFSYDVRCVQNSSGGMDVFDGTGRKDTFKPGTNGIYTCPEFFREGTFSNNVFRLTFADTGYWEFNPFSASADAGKLAFIVDRNGNTMSLAYDTSGLISQIVDDLGRTNSISYNTDGRVASVTDFSGRTVTYQYYAGKPGEPGSTGDLKSVTSPAVTGTPNRNDFPSGKTTTYGYSTGYSDERENHLLLWNNDPYSEDIQRYVYQHNQTDLEFLRCISVQRGTNTPTMLSYLPQTPTPANQFATLRCIINDPVGNVAAISTDARGRCVKLEEFTGRATPGTTVTNTASLPIPRLRLDDPASYVTQMSWNEDSLCTATTLPDGSREEAVHQRAYNQNSARSNHPKAALHNGDVRVIRQRTAPVVTVDFDGDGIVDATERVWRFEYDPRFGSDPTAARARSIITVKPGSGSSGGTTKGMAKGIVTTKPSSGGTGGTTKGMAKGIMTAKPGSGSTGGTTKGTGGPSGRGIRDIQAGEVCDDGNTISGDGCSSDYKVNQTAGEQCDSGLGNSGDNFVISATDPRGNVTTTSYDTNGNCVSRIWPKPGYWSSNESVESFSYNSHGQLTAITDAADANGYRRVDRLTYHSSGPQTGYLQSIAIDEPGVQLTTSFEYDSRGNVARVVDPRGNDFKFHNNALNQCVRMESPTNLTARCVTDFFYDANDNLVQCATEVRDENDALVGMKIDRASYDSLGRLTEMALAIDATRALTNRFIYNGNDQCVLALGGDAVSGADPHHAVAYQYDERGDLFREIGAPGGSAQTTTQWDYDSNGNLVRVSEGAEGEPAITTFEYDGFAGGRYAIYSVQKGARGMSVSEAKPQAPREPREGFDGSSILECGTVGSKAKAWMVNNFEVQPVRLAKITDPMGNVTTFNYDANNNLKVFRHFGETNDVPGSVGNLRLAESRYEYDELDRMIRSHELFFSLPSQAPIGDGERTTTFAYAPNGQCSSVTDDLGRVTTFGYDTASRLTSVSSPGGASVLTYVRDAGGNVLVLRQTDRPDQGGAPQSFSWTNVFDSLNRCVSTTDNVGITQQFAYDSLDRCVKFDRATVQSWFAYDHLGRLTVAIRDLDGDGVPELGTDFTELATWSTSNGRLLSTADSHTNTTSYAYDSLGRCVQVTKPDGTHQSLVWSPRSNLIQETDANGTVIHHTYDLNDRCVSNNIVPAAGVASTTTFETFIYDGFSRLVMASNNVSQLDFGYDSMGNLDETKQDCIAAAAAFDSMGNRVSFTYPGGRVLTYAYDGLDQCTNIVESGASLVSASYAGPGRVARVNYGNGMRTHITYDGLAGIPNVAGDFGHRQVSRVVHGSAVTLQTIAAMNLQFDRNGNKTLRVDAIFTQRSARTNELGLQYDAADRLVRASVISGSTLLRDTIYGLDRMGNRTNVTGAMTCSGLYFMDATAAGLDFQMNQYTATPCDTRNYDNNGNLLNRADQSYLFDCYNRLVQVQVVDPGTGASTPLANYSYDALGRRSSKTVFAGGLPPKTTQFLYDGDDVIEEREGGIVLAATVRPHMHQTATHIRISATGERTYAHADDQGNVLALTGANGVVLERYNYDDYGAVTFLTSDGIQTSATSSAVGNVYFWGGLRGDSETGLQTDDSGSYHDSQSGRVIAVPWVPSNPSIPHRMSTGNNPWSGNGIKAQDHNSSRSNKTASIADFGGSGGGSLGLTKPRDPWKTYWERNRYHRGHVTLMK